MKVPEKGFQPLLVSPTTAQQGQCPLFQGLCLAPSCSVNPQCPREELVKEWASAAPAAEPVVSLHLP